MNLSVTRETRLINQIICKLQSMFHPRLWCYSLLAVFLFGISTIVITRLIFYLYHPKYFAHTIPTISKTAAFPPGSYFFTAGMTLVSVCIIISWILIYKLNNARIEKPCLNHSNLIVLRLLNTGSCVLGVYAAIFLALVANITLEDDSDFHISFSKYFFFSQTMAFIMDTFFRLISRKVATDNDFNNEGFFFYLKYSICILVIFDAVFFLFMYEYKDSLLFSDRYFAQQLYIVAEHTTALLSFSYSAAYFPEVYRYYNTAHVLSRHFSLLLSNQQYDINRSK